MLAVEPVRVLAGGASSVDADASSLGGRGAAAAIALSDLATRATLSGRLDLDSPSVTVTAENTSSRLGATADSAGGQGIPVGALAVGVARTVTASTLAAGAVLTGRQGATDAVFGSSSTGSATADAAAGGAAPSLAVLVADHTTESVADLGSDLVAPHDATWRARTRDVAVSDASRGSAAGNAVTLSTVRTRALLAAGPALTGSGALTLEADQEAEARSRATLVALTFTDHRAVARSDRDVRMSGPVTVSARNRTTSTSVTNPAVHGPGVSPALVVALLRDLADHVALSQSAVGTGSVSLPALGSAVVDSIALNVVHHDASAVLPDGITVVSGGPLGVLAESFLTAVAAGGSAGGSGSSADHTAVAVNLVRRVVVVVVSRETESAGDLTVRAGRGPPGTELISASSTSHPGSTTLNQVTSSVTTTVRGTTTIDSTTGATPVAAPQTPAFTPPAGSVLITSRGGIVRLGAATLTFAAGAVARDTWVLIRLKPVGAGTGVLATSAVFELLAFDAATGAEVSHFAVAPRLSVEVGVLAPASTVYYLDPETGAEVIGSSSTGGVVTAALPHFSDYVVGLTGDDLLGAISTALGGTIPTTQQDLGEKLLAGVFKLTGLKVTYSTFTISGTGPDKRYTGTVSISATGGAIGAGITLGALTATYTLDNDLATAGHLLLHGERHLHGRRHRRRAGPADRARHRRAGHRRRDGQPGPDLLRRRHRRADPRRHRHQPVRRSHGRAARDAHQRFPGSRGARQRPCCQGRPAGHRRPGLDHSGSGVKLKAPSWRFGINELTDLDSAPVEVPTPAGTLTLDLADGTVALAGAGTLTLGTLGTVSGSYAISISANALEVTITGASASFKVGSYTVALTGLGGRVTVTAAGFDFGATGSPVLRGAGTLPVGALGTVTGTFELAKTSSGMTLKASNVEVELSAGSASASLTGGTGDLTISTTTGVSGTLAGTLGLDGVPGLGLGGTVTLTINTGANTFSLVGAGYVRVAGLIDLAGTLTVTRTTSQISVSVAGASSASASLTLSNDGSYSFAVSDLPLSLPIAVPGVTLSGKAAVSGGTATGFTMTVTDAKLVTPAGVVAGTLTITRAGQVLDVTGSGLTVFVGDRRTDDGGADDLGVLVTVSSFAARLLASGAVAFRAEGALEVVGVSGVTFGGTVVASYNPTDGDLTFANGQVVTALTRSVAGALTVALPGSVNLSGTVSITSQGAGDAAVITVEATGVEGQVGTATSGTRMTFTDGSFTLRRDKDGTAVSAAMTVALAGASTDYRLSGTVSITSNGTTTTVTGTGLVITVGPVSVTGGFTISSSGSITTITVTGARLAVDGLVEVTGINGSVVIGGTPAVVVTLTATSATATLGPLTLTGGLAVDTTGIVFGTTGTPAKVTVAGRELFGVFTVKRVAGATVISADKVTVDLGVATLTNTSLTLTVSPAGVIGRMSSSVAVTVGGLSMGTVAVTLDVDTTGAAPHVKLTATVVSAISVGGGSITAGTLVIEKQGTTTAVALTGVVASGSGFSLTSGSGVLVTSGAGIAGYLGGRVTTPAGTVDGTVRLNTTTGAVDVTVDADGTPLRIVFGANEGSLFEATVSGSLDFGPISIEGTISFRSQNGKEVFGGTGLTIFFGQGPLTLANGERNPMARGLLIEGATVGLVKSGTGFALDASGTASIVGLDGVTVGGTVRVRYNTLTASTGTPLQETISLGTAGDVVVRFEETGVAEVTGTGLTLEVLGQSFGGDLVLKRTSGGIDFGLTNLSASLSAGGREFARLTGGAGALRIAGGTLVSTAPLTGTLTFTLPAGTLTGTFSLDVDTAPTTRKLEFSATAAKLEVNGTVVTADVTYRRALVGGVTVQTLVIKNGGVEIKTAPTGATLLALENGAGSLTFGSGGLSGSFGGTVKTGAGITGFALSGTLAVTVDTAAGYLKVVGTGVTLNVDSTLSFTADVAVERSVGTDGVTRLSVAVSGASFTASGVSLSQGTGTLVVTGATYTGSIGGVVTVDVPGVSVTGALALAVTRPASGAATLKLTGTGLVVRVLGQSFSGDLDVTRVGTTQTTFTLSNATFDLADGLLRVTNASATVGITSGALVALSVSGTVALTVPGLSLSATTLSVAIEGSGAGRSLVVTATGAALVASGLSLNADLTFRSGADANGGRIMRITFANAAGDSVKLLDLTGVVTIGSGSGEVVTTAGGTTGSLTLGEVTFVPALGLSATSVAVTFGGGNTTVAVTGAQLTLAGNTLKGSVAISMSGTSKVVAFTGVEIFTSGSTTPLIQGGEGAFVINPGTATGFAGYLTGTLKVDSGGVKAGATGFVRVNTTGGAVDQQIEVGGRTVAVTFSSTDPSFAVSVSSMTLEIGDFVTIEGSFTYTTVSLPPVTTGGVSTTASVFAGQGLRIFIGRGPAFAGTGGISPLATGVLLTQGTIGLVQVGTGPTATYAVEASGTVQLVGVDAVTLGGTATVRVNTLGRKVDQSIEIAGSTLPPVRVLFADGAQVKSFRLTGATLGVLGQSITTDLVVEKAANGDLVIGLRNAGLVLGPITVADASGVFVLTPTGAAGRISGTLRLDVPGVTFGAGLTVAVNTLGVAVSRTVSFGDSTTHLDLAAGPFVQVDGTAIAVTVMEQTLTADVSVTRSTAPDGTTTTVIGLDRVGFSIGTSTGGYGVTLVNGSGVLVVTAAGVAGRLGGQVGLVLPAGVTATGTLALAINTTSVAVHRTVEVDGRPLTLSLPGGPYLRFEATGFVLTVLGQTISGDVSFERATAPIPAGSPSGTPAPTVVRVALANVSVSMAGVLSLRNGSALLVVAPAGLAGSISGDLALTVPGVSLGGTLALEVNTTGAKVEQTFTVGGVPATLALESGRFVRVAGKGLSLDVLGQRLTGDLVITRSTDAAGLPTLRITAKNLALVLGSGATTVTATQVADTEAVLVLAPTGVTAKIAVTVAASVPGVVLDGTLSLEVDSARGYVKVSAVQAKLVLVGQELRADLTVESTGTGTARRVRIGVTRASLTLGSGIASISNGRGALLLAGGGVAGELAVDLTVEAGTGLALSGAFSVAVNTTGAAVHDSVEAGSGTVAIDLPAGPYLRVSATGVVLVAAGQKLSGDVSVEKSGSSVRVVATNVRLQLGDGNRALVRLTDGAADLTLGAGSVVGTVSGTVALVDVPKVGLAGSFTALINSAGADTSVDTAKLRLVGENLLLSIAGQSIAAEKITFARYGTTTKTTSLSITNGELTFADATGKPLVRAYEISGNLTMVGGTGAASGAHGAISAKVAVDVPGVSMTGTFLVEMNGTGSQQTVNGTLMDAGKLRITAKDPDPTKPGATLTIAGQSIGADVVVEVTPTSGPDKDLTLTADNGRAVLIAVTNLTLDLGGAVTVTRDHHWSGVVLIADGKVAAKLAGSLTTTSGTTGVSIFTGLPSGITISGTVGFVINTGATKVDLSYGTGSGTAFTVDPGPYLKVTVTAGTLAVSGLSFAGSFSIERSLRPGFTGSTFTATISNTAALAAGDLDKNGRADLVVGQSVGDGTATKPGYGVLLAGAPVAGQQQAISYTSASADQAPFVAGAVSRVQLIDLDGDGWLDIVVVTGTKVAMLRNRGRDSNGAWLGLLAWGSQLDAAGATALALGDVTGDGRADVVVTGGAATGQGTRVYVNSATGVATTAVTVAGGANATGAVLVDVNNDGRRDLVLSRSTGSDSYQLGTGTSAIFGTATLLDTVNSGFVAVGDLNGDGYADVVTAGERRQADGPPQQGRADRTDVVAGLRRRRRAPR